MYYGCSGFDNVARHSSLSTMVWNRELHHSVRLLHANNPVWVSALLYVMHVCKEKITQLVLCTQDSGARFRVYDISNPVGNGCRMVGVGANLALVYLAAVFFHRTFVPGYGLLPWTQVWASSQLHMCLLVHFLTAIEVVKMFSAVSSILVTQEMDSVFKTLSTDCRH
jgi:hypothetical protein